MNRVFPAVALALALAAPAGAALEAPPTITVGSNPIDIAVSPQRSEAYVANDGSVSVVDLRTRQQVAEVGTGFDDQTAIGLVRDGRRAYIGTFDLARLVVFDTVSRSVVGHVRVGYGASGIASATTPAGQFAFVGLLTAKRLAVVRGRDDKVVASLRLPAGPQTVATAPGGKVVWVGSSYSGRIWVVSTTTFEQVASIRVPDSGPVASIAFSPDGRWAWVSGAGGVSVVDRDRGRVVAFVPLPLLFPNAESLNPGEIALNNLGTAALVVNSTFPDSPGLGALAVVDTETLRVTRRFGLGTEPIAMAIDRRRARTYVTNYMDDTLSVFRTPR